MATTRNRIIYNVLGLYAGQNNAVSGSHTGVGDVKQLTRVQSFDEDFSRNLTNINQYGNLAAIDRIEVEAPTVKASTSYYITDGSNEKYLGLTVTTGSQPEVSAVSGLITKVTDQKNLFLLIADEGNDTVGYNGTSGVIGLGNAFIASYTVEGAVGDIPKASVDFEALNVRVYGQLQVPSGVNGSSGSLIPSVNIINGLPITGYGFSLPQSTTNDNANQVNALQPGDITLNISGTIGVQANDLKIQNFKAGLELSRTPIQRLGNKFAFSREINFPAKATFSIDAELGNIQDGNLADVLCQTGFVDLSVILKKPDCSGNGVPALKYTLKGAKLLSQKLTTAIGSNAKFTADWEAQIGSPQDLIKGIFISGSYI
jgi:hypothetical protein